MTPDEYCAKRAAASGSSFYYSFALLPPQRRQAILALYAFCREVDDVVDECPDPALARVKLDWWDQELAALGRGNPQHPVTRALADARGRYDLPEASLREILIGVGMDLTISSYPDFAALQLYCHRVAGVVGELSATIFGYEDPGTLVFARSLGLALQLTNIVRDVGEDARRGRLYLPLDELERFGVTPQGILHNHPEPGFGALMGFQIERARQCYAQALAALPAVDRRSQRPGLVMGAIYRALLEEIAGASERVLRERTSLTPLRKVWIAWATWMRA